MVVITKTRDNKYMISNGIVLKTDLGYSEVIATASWLYRLDSTKVRVALITARFREHDMVEINNVTFKSSKIDYTNILE